LSFVARRAKKDDSTWRRQTSKQEQPVDSPPLGQIVAVEDYPKPQPNSHAKCEYLD
jgi:hypothetical protein